jgi:hypothetical protein
MSAAGTGSSRQNCPHLIKGAGSRRQTVTAGLERCMGDDALLGGPGGQNVLALANPRSAPSQTVRCFPKRMHTKRL